MPNSVPSRLTLIDSIRGTAVILMVAFHFCFDLRYFGFVDWQVPNGPGWWQFRYLILSLFLGAVGVSFSLAQGGTMRWRAFFVRQIKLLLAAASITLVSVFLFPQTWIYFGILHFILVASFVCLLLRKLPGLALILGISIILGSIFGYLSGSWPFVYLAKYLPRHTEDFVPFFPWLGVCFVGLYLGDILRRHQPPFSGAGEPITAFLGRHALTVYLLHQPILFGAFYAYLSLSALRA